MRLLCKQITPNTYDALTVNKYYELEKDAGWWYYLPADDNGEGLWFLNSVVENDWYLWTHFYTPQEERKLKLNQIYETTL